MILPPQQSTCNIVRRTFSPLSVLEISLAFQQTYLSCVCRLVLMLGSPINTFLPEYSGASPSAFSIVRRGYWKPVLTSFPRQHTRVTLLTFERRTRENRSTDLRKIASRRHQYVLTTRPPPVSKKWFSSDRAVAKHSASDNTTAHNAHVRMYRPSREDVLYKSDKSCQSGSPK